MLSNIPLVKKRKNAYTKKTKQKNTQKQHHKKNKK